MDGGAAANDMLMQFQADLLRRAGAAAGGAETTALGAAYLAGLATVSGASPEEIARQARRATCALSRRWRQRRRHERRAALATRRDAVKSAGQS